MYLSWMNSCTSSVGVTISIGAKTSGVEASAHGEAGAEEAEAAEVALAGVVAGRFDDADQRDRHGKAQTRVSVWSPTDWGRRARATRRAAPSAGPRRRPSARRA